MKRKILIIIKHVAAIAFIFLLELKLLSVVKSKDDFSLMLTFFVVDVSLYYFFRYWIYPFVASKQQWLYWFLVLPFIFTCFFVVSYLTGVVYTLATSPHGKGNYPLSKLTLSVLASILVCGAASLSFYRQWSKVKMADAIKAESLRQQALVNPHLTLNGLNVLYDRALKADEKLAEFVSVMADTIRFGLKSEMGNGMISLKDEIDFLEQYQKFRQLLSQIPLFSQMRTDFTIDPETVMIPQAILVTFVDNMYKYGDLSDNNHPGMITISCNKKSLDFHVHNRKLTDIQHGTGVGIANARFRLNYAFGRRYNLTVTDKKTAFETNLTIKL